MGKITELFKIQYPVISGGMIWCSGWELVSAVSNSGGLGLLGAGSMHPDVLREHIRKTSNATKNPFGVNLPLLYPEQEKAIEIIIEEGVKIVFTSAGSPKKWTETLHQHGIIVAHVVSSSLFAKKSEEAGVDAIVAEGFEAGGHDGKEETTTLSLIPAVKRAVSIPVIAAGGISTGEQMLAALALGADGVQIGSLFAASLESSAHPDFKRLLVEAGEGSTRLMLKQVAPVRLLRNNFYRKVEEAEAQGASIDSLKELLGKGRAKRGMFEGDIEEGELEIGQGASYIKAILPVATIFQNLLLEFQLAKKQLNTRSNEF
jgi:enoyl-[acyl-carrier protein] reductase II